MNCVLFDMGHNKISVYYVTCKENLGGIVCKNMGPVHWKVAVLWRLRATISLHPKPPNHAEHQGAFLPLIMLITKRHASLCDFSVMCVFLKMCVMSCWNIYYPLFVFLLPSSFTISPAPLHFCSFSQKLQATVHLLAPECDITFLVSEDGSGKGAAMVTAVSQRLALQSRLLEDSDGEEGDK